ncbi:type II toxin-antitoxin system Phd/YefM family antitoxin [Thiolapillus sp.]
MKQVGSYEAKSKLPALLRAVVDGEHIVITRSGKPIAELIPHRRSAGDIAETITRIKAMRQGIALGDNELKAMIEEGRR